MTVSSTASIVTAQGDGPMSATCLWCGRPFVRRKDGGRSQRFCSKPCRMAFFSAIRAWALMMVEESTVTVGEIRKALAAKCTLAGRASADGPVSEGSDAHRPLVPPEVPPWRGIPGWPTAR